MTFGAFISTRRKEAKLNLRDTAKHLGISNGYLCDIEQGRRPAPEGAFVERISSFLELDKQEHEMLLDLAADEGKTSLDESHGLVEWQADALATALLMPLPQIKRSFYRLRAGRSNEQLVAEMAQIFQVSKQAMRIRLETRNLI